QSDDDAGNTTTLEDGVQVIDAGAAGMVTIDVTNGVLTLVSVDQADGWSYEIDKATATDIEVKLRNGSQEVEVEIEIENGMLKTKVKTETSND
ncbi:MAG: hypothetical protein GXP36_15520, partial [Actinobacteria bacterium]|nr:hypothetical protein [Actinomycetota bacterium]